MLNNIGVGHKVGRLGSVALGDGQEVTVTRVGDGHDTREAKEVRRRSVVKTL